MQRLEHEQQAMRDDYEHRLMVAEREREDSVAALSDSLRRREEEQERQVKDSCVLFALSDHHPYRFQKSF